MLKSRARRLTVLESCGGGGGLFIYTADEYTHTHIDSGIFFFNFSMISLGRVWFVGKKIFLCLHISKSNKIIGPYY